MTPVGLQDTVPYQATARWPKISYYEITNGAFSSQLYAKILLQQSWPKQRDCNIGEAVASFEPGQKAWSSFLFAIAEGALPVAASDSLARGEGEVEDP